jgi:hypothetical protein
VQPQLTVVCRFRPDGEYLDSSIVAVHWLRQEDGVTNCWYPPERWQNKPGEFRLLPVDDGEWFEVSDGHMHLMQIRTQTYREAHQWLDEVSSA